MLRAGQRKVRNRITRLENNAETLVKNIPLRHNIGIIFMRESDVKGRAA